MNQSDKLKEAAEAYAERRAPNPSKYDAPFFTKVDQWDEAYDAFIAGAEYALSLPQSPVVGEWVPLSDRSAPMPDDEELLVLFDTGEVILYSQDNWPEAMVTHWRLANLPKV